MANLKSSQKDARTSKVRKMRNTSRRSECKTLVKKVEEAISLQNGAQARELMKIAESAIARAKGKELFKQNTASRKISKLAKKVALLERKAA